MSDGPTEETGARKDTGNGGSAASTPPPTAPGGADDKGVAELVLEVSERASVLVREEIELAKTEVTEKANSLLRGGVVALVAGVFVLLALAMVMHGVAWLLNDLFFDNFWAGFLIEAGFFLLVAAGAGLYAYRAFKKASPPTPDMAIEEARELKSTLEAS